MLSLLLSRKPDFLDTEDFFRIENELLFGVSKDPADASFKFFIT